MKQKINNKNKLNQKNLKEDTDFELAIAVRSKHYGLSLEQAKHPEASTYLGRLFLKGILTQEQYQAVQNFLELRHNYLKSIGTYGIYYNDEPSLELEDFEDYACKIKKQYNACLKFIAQECNRAALNIVEYVLVRDIEMPHFMQQIKKICVALDKFFSELLTNKKNNLN